VRSEVECEEYMVWFAEIACRNRREIIAMNDRADAGASPTYWHVEREGLVFLDGAPDVHPWPLDDCDVGDD